MHRAAGQPHPLMTQYHVDAVPYPHAELDAWRDSLRRGITYPLPHTNLLITGGVDDVWVNPAGELIIVDYKATAKAGEVTLDADWQIGYKRQMEVYQWLFRMNGFRVNDTGYFVYANGNVHAPAFDGKVEFNVTLIPYTGDPSWIEPTLREMYSYLRLPSIPSSDPECDYCRYVSALAQQKMNLVPVWLDDPELGKIDTVVGGTSDEELQIRIAAVDPERNS